MQKIKVVFTGGGTGGHVYPNIAIYETIKDKYPESLFLYIGIKGGAEYRITKNIPQPIEFTNILSKGIPQKIKSIKTLFSLFIIFLGTIKSYFVLKKFKPDIIIGSGGYAAAPVLIAASLLKLKVFLHEQNAVPGRLNRFISRFATKIGVSFPSTVNYFPENKAVVTGYPLRKSIVFSREENIKKKYNIPEKNKVLFVLGGSGGAKSINKAIAELMPRLLSIENMTLIWSTGRGYSKEYRAYEDTVKILENSGISPDIESKLIMREYFDDIDEIYSISDLIISRAGAGSIKEITTLGIPSILIPKINLPGDHQILNAREVQKVGGAKIVYEEVMYKNKERIIFVPQTTLFEVLKETLFEGDYLFNMRKNLRQIEKQNSSELILKEIEQIIEGKEKIEEKQIKVFYLHSLDTEKNIELIFDSTTVGNSFLCDAFIDGIEKDVLMEFKVISGDERVILKKIKGDILLNGGGVKKWTEIREDDKLEIGNRIFTLKCFFEKVEKFHFEKKTSSKIWSSSFGIIISRVGGFFREVVIAAFFGAQRATDIFAVGLTISNFMRRIVAENALENAFLPIFSRIFHRVPRKKTWDSASSIINFTILLSIIFTVLGILLTPVIVRLLFPKFIEKGMIYETINMTRIMFPYLFLVTIAAILATYLKAFDRFGIAESSAVFFSIGTITGVVLFYPTSGLYSLAYGVLLGGIMQIIILIPFVSKIFKSRFVQFSYKPKISFNSVTNKKYYSQLGPISIDVFLANTTEIVAQILAHALQAGAIAYLYFAKTIFRLPFAVISQAINSVVLKEFSDRIALFEKEKAKRLFIDGIKTNIFLLTPISILMIVLAKPIVTLLLERGNFSHSNVINTSLALQFYSIGLIGWGLHSFTVRIFAARMDVKTSMILNFFMLGSNIVLCYYLVKTSLTFRGLALATSISYIFFSFIRIIVLKNRLEKENIRIKYKYILTSLFKTFFSALLMIIVLREAKFVFNQIDFNSKTLENVFLLVSLTFIGISVYFLSSLLLKNTEILIFKKKFFKKSVDVPISMLSPFSFLDKVSKEPDNFKDDYFYKINIYTSNEKWEVRNIGIKLIGLFKDKSKINYLIETLKSKKENGFIRRNSLIALRQLNIWNSDIKNLIMELINDSYYEVRVAAINYLTKCCKIDDYKNIKSKLIEKLKKSCTEEKIALIKLIARVGNKEELEFIDDFYLSSNSLIREELLELVYSFYRRKLLSEEEVKEQISKILVTSNNLEPEFKIKTIIKKIYKEIE